MYCMMKGNHVYTLNYNIKTLQQKYETDNLIVVKASPNYHKEENTRLQND